MGLRSKKHVLREKTLPLFTIAHEIDDPVSVVVEIEGVNPPLLIGLHVLDDITGTEKILLAVVNNYGSTIGMGGVHFNFLQG
jgi:hypothetical protein